MWVVVETRYHMVHVTCFWDRDDKRVTCVLPRMKKFDGVLGKIVLHKI